MMCYQTRISVHDTIILKTPSKTDSVERVVVGGRMNLSIMAILDIIAWDDMICMVGLRYQRWLALA